MTRGPDRALPRAAIAVGIAFLLSHAIGLAIAPRESVPTCAACIEFRLDPNVASREELMLLPGIGPGMADRIIAFRERAAARPAFSQIEDLDAVDRIGPGAIERLRPHLLFPVKHD